jgi:hypothetical protein
MYNKLNLKNAGQEPFASSGRILCELQKNLAGDMRIYDEIK